MKQNLIMKTGRIGLKTAALSLILSVQAAAAFAAEGSKAAAKEISTATATVLTYGKEAAVKPPVVFVGPALSAAPFALTDADMKDLRDSLADTRCKDAPERANQLEGQILDLKARYWALRIRNGIKMEGVRHNLGSTITDPLLKKEFHDRMRKWFAERDIPELNAREVTEFVDADTEAFALHRECGL